MMRLKVRDRGIKSMVEAVIGTLRVDNVVFVHKTDKPQQFAITTK